MWISIHDIAPAKGKSRVQQISEFSDSFWENAIRRLTLHANRKMSRLNWHGCAGIGPDDIAADAITKVIDGKRKWDGKQDLYDYLRSVVDSMISAKVKGFDNKYSRTLCGTSTEDEYEVPDDIGSPDMFVADQDEVNHFRAKLQNALAKDSLAWEVFEAIENEIVKPADIAELLGMSVEEIYVVKKRLQRAVETVRPNYIRKGKNHARA